MRQPVGSWTGPNVFVSLGHGQRNNSVGDYQRRFRSILAIYCIIVYLHLRNMTFISTQTCRVDIIKLPKSHLRLTSPAHFNKLQISSRMACCRKKRSQTRTIATLMFGQRAIVRKLSTASYSRHHHHQHHHQDPEWKASPEDSITGFLWLSSLPTRHSIFKLCLIYSHVKQ